MFRQLSDDHQIDFRLIFFGIGLQYAVDVGVAEMDFQFFVEDYFQQRITFISSVGGQMDISFDVERSIHNVFLCLLLVLSGNILVEIFFIFRE